MENKRKLTKKEKLLIIFIILFSIISITYKAYGNSTILAWGRYAEEANGNHTEDWPHYLHGAPFNTIFTNEPDYYQGGPEGVVYNQGGRTNNSGHQDNGEEHVIDGAGSDGNTGYGGSWNGSANFPLKSEVISTRENFEPHDDTDHNGNKMDRIIWLKDLCSVTGLLCSAPGSALTGSLNYINPKYADSSK